MSVLFESETSKKVIYTINFHLYGLIDELKGERWWMDSYANFTCAEPNPADTRRMASFVTDHLPEP